MTALQEEIALQREASLFGGSCAIISSHLLPPSTTTTSFSMSSSYSNQHTHEQQNDDSLNRLFNKVHSLVRTYALSHQREITLHIHNDAEQQHSLLQDTVCMRA
jgi:hypothetical protein